MRNNRYIRYIRVHDCTTCYTCEDILPSRKGTNIGPHRINNSTQPAHSILTNKQDDQPT